MVKCIHGPDGCDDWLCYGYRGDGSEPKKANRRNKIVKYKPVTQAEIDWKRRIDREAIRRYRLKARQEYEAMMSR